MMKRENNLVKKSCNDRWKQGFLLSCKRPNKHTNTQPENSDEGGKKQPLC